MFYVENSQIEFWGLDILRFFLIEIINYKISDVFAAKINHTLLTFQGCSFIWANNNFAIILTLTIFVKGAQAITHPGFAAAHAHARLEDCGSIYFEEIGNGL